jgi:hypothetical protein
MHIEYLERGEKIYAARVDSVSPHSGYNRVVMEVFIYTQRIDHIRFYWNTRSDSADFNIGNKAGSFNFIIENLPERDYLFEVVSFDKFGNKSFPFEVSIKTYGENYRSGLWSKPIRSVLLQDDGFYITWGIAPENSLYSELIYADSEGHEHILSIPNDETVTAMEPQTILRFRTLIQPPEVIDTFYLDWEPAPALVESTPFKGPHILSAANPCIIEARNFDFGGEGLAFHDINTINDTGESYRADNGDPAGGVADIEGGGNIAHNSAGEWLVYTVEVQDAGLYEADVYLSVRRNTGMFSMSFDGNKSETTTVPNNDSWNAWRWVFETYPNLKPTQPKFRLSAGKHKIRFTKESGDFNFMSYKFTRIGN